MKFSLKSLMIGITLASLYIGSITCIIRLIQEAELTYQGQWFWGLVLLLVFFCPPISLFGAFVGRRRGRTKQGAICAAVAAAIAVYVLHVFTFVSIDQM